MRGIRTEEGTGTGYPPSCFIINIRPAMDAAGTGNKQAGADGFHVQSQSFIIYTTVCNCSFSCFYKSSSLRHSRPVGFLHIIYRVQTYQRPSMLERWDDVETLLEWCFTNWTTSIIVKSGVLSCTYCVWQTSITVALAAWVIVSCIDGLSGNCWAGFNWFRAKEEQKQLQNNPPNHISPQFLLHLKLVGSKKTNTS